MLHTKKGFTLVELMIVIAITTILAIGGTMTYSRMLENARVSKGVKFENNYRTIYKSLQAEAGWQVIGEWDLNDWDEGNQRVTDPTTGNYLYAFGGSGPAQIDAETGPYSENFGFNSVGTDGYLAYTGLLTYPTEEFTASGWVYRASGGSNDYFVDNQGGLNVWFGSDDSVRYDGGVDSGTANVGDYPAGRWYYWVVTWTPNKMSMYIDGVQIFDENFGSSMTTGVSLFFISNFDGNIVSPTLLNGYIDFSEYL